jgi:hypothetical protein
MNYSTKYNNYYNMLADRFKWGSVLRQRRLLLVVVLIALCLLMTDSFLITETLSHARYCGIGAKTDRLPVVFRKKYDFKNEHRQGLVYPSRRTTKLYFMGSDNGLLGVGGPEIVRQGSF